MREGSNGTGNWCSALQEAERCGEYGGLTVRDDILDKNESLQLLYESIRCCYPMYHWEYDAALCLLYTDCPDISLQDDMLGWLHFSEILCHEKDNLNIYPFILDAGFGLRWITCPFLEDGVLSKYHLIGPVHTGAINFPHLRSYLTTYGLTNDGYESIVRLVKNVPVVPSQTVTQYAIMLHYALTGDCIGASEIRVLSREDIFTKKETENYIGEAMGTWATEQQFMQLITEGNSDYVEILDKLFLASGGFHLKHEDEVRKGKNSALMLLALTARAAIRGGVSPAIAYALQNEYADRIENAISIAALQACSLQLIQNYVDCVQARRKNPKMSIAIQNTCDYIEINLQKDLSIFHLAGRVGYSEYYFTSKFRKETGKNIKDYILEKKMERAAKLLIESKLKNAQIAELLGFQSYSYFYKCFREWSGKTPSKYREQWFE